MSESSRPGTGQDSENYSHVLASLNTNASCHENGDTKARDRMVADCLKLVAKLETPGEAFMRIMWSHSIHPVAMRIASDMNLFKYLADSSGPVTVSELANKSGGDPSLVRRVLKTLTACHVVLETGFDTFKPTSFSIALSTQMFREALDFMVPWAFKANLDTPAYFADTGFKNPMNPLDTPVQFAHGGRHKDHIFDMYARNPSLGQGLASLMKVWKSPRPHWSDEKIGFYPFSELVTGTDNTSNPVFMVDIGGSQGQDFQRLLSIHPEAPSIGKMVVEDLPHVISSIPAGSLPDSIQTQAYDFFTPQPVIGARVYFMHSILHDFPDVRSREILKNLIPAMKKGYSKLLLWDIVLPDTKAGMMACDLDWEMMTFFAASERSEREWKALIESVEVEVEIDEHGNVVQIPAAESLSVAESNAVDAGSSKEDGVLSDPAQVESAKHELETSENAVLPSADEKHTAVVPQSTGAVPQDPAQIESAKHELESSENAITPSTSSVLVDQADTTTSNSATAMDVPPNPAHVESAKYEVDTSENAIPLSNGETLKDQVSQDPVPETPAHMESTEPEIATSEHTAAANTIQAAADPVADNSIAPQTNGVHSELVPAGEIVNATTNTVTEPAIESKIEDDQLAQQPAANIPATTPTPVTQATDSAQPTTGSIAEDNAQFADKPATNISKITSAQPINESKIEDDQFAQRPAENMPVSTSATTDQAANLTQPITESVMENNNQFADKPTENIPTSTSAQPTNDSKIEDDQLAQQPAENIAASTSVTTDQAADSVQPTTESITEDNDQFADKPAENVPQVQAPAPAPAQVVRKEIRRLRVNRIIRYSENGDDQDVIECEIA